MVYLIIEDIGAGYDFWEKVSTEIFKGSVRLYTCNGVSNYYNVIERMEIKEEDTLVLILDNINSGLTIDLIIDTEYMSLSEGFKLIVSEIYCFEEILLSAPKIYDWMEIREEYKNVIDHIRKSIEKDVLRDYVRDGEIRKFNDNKKEKLNREKTVFNILSEITRNTTFKVKKGNLSGCWINYCCYYKEENPYIDIASQKCKLKFNLLNSKEKLMTILTSRYVTNNLDLESIIDSIEKDKDIKENIRYKDELCKIGYGLKRITEHYSNLDIVKSSGVDIFEIVYEDLKLKSNTIKGF